MATPRSEERISAKKNGHAVAGGSLPEGWNLWLSLGKATALLNAPTSFVYRMVAEGNIRTLIAPDGLTKYNPDDVKECRALLETDSEKKAGGLTADEFKAGNELVKFVMTSFERMVPILVSGFESSNARAVEQLDRLETIIEKREARIKVLEEERDRNAAEREKQLSDEHARRLVEASFEAGERRKDKAFGVLTDKFAPIVFSKLGLDQNPKIKSGMALLTSIKRDQMLALLALGDMLEENQKRLILELLGELTNEERAALEDCGAITKKESPPPSAEAKTGE